MRPVCGGDFSIRLKPGLRKSASISSVRLPLLASKAAKLAAVVDLPSPGSAETTPITRSARPCSMTSLASLALRRVSANIERGAFDRDTHDAFEATPCSASSAIAGAAPACMFPTLFLVG